MKLTTTSYAVLGLVRTFGPATVYDLKQALEKSVENFWPIPHTTFYAEPDKLAKAGLLAVEQEPGGRRRKVYSVTPEGEQAIAEWVAEPSAAPPQLHDELVLKLFMGADPRPLLEERLAFYREKLAELEGYLAVVETEGIRRSLIAGTEYNRSQIAMFERVLGA
jgi:DNA-binding PadR family transcriptional regulator